MEMERSPRMIGSPRKLQTNLLCIPRLKNATKSSSSSNKAAKGLSPMTALLDRLREAVFRLIMLSALSSTNNNDRAGGGAHGHHVKYSPASSSHGAAAKRYDNDHRHSEAVADCIEFIKKKAGPDDQIGRDSSASSSRDSTSEGVATPALEDMCCHV